MTTDQPLSLSEAQRLAPNTDTILLRATRPADLETPIGAFLRLDDGGPAYLLESVEGGERLGRYSFLGVGPRAAALGGVVLHATNVTTLFVGAGLMLTGIALVSMLNPAIRSIKAADARVGAPH